MTISDLATSDSGSTNIEDAARALLENRIEAVRALAHARQGRIDKRGELDVAERAEAAAFAAAQRAGWSATELKKVGLDQPSRQAPGRPRRSRAAGGSAAPARGGATTSDPAPQDAASGRERPAAAAGP